MNGLKRNNNSPPLASVCIPTYNRVDLLEACLESLARQTYENIEILVADNASTDSTRKLMKKWAKKDGRIRYIRHPKNIGSVENWKSLLKYSRSELVGIYHDDDLFGPTLVEKQVRILKNMQEVAVVCPMIRQVDTGRNTVFTIRYDIGWVHDFRFALNERISRHREYNALIGNMEGYLPMLARLKTWNPFGSTGVMFRKSEFEKTFGFQTEKYSYGYEDLDLWLQFLENGNSVAIIEEPLIWYRVTPNNGWGHFEKKHPGKICLSSGRIIMDRIRKYPEFVPDDIEQKFRHFFHSYALDMAVENLFQKKTIDAEGFLAAAEMFLPTPQRKQLLGRIKYYQLTSLSKKISKLFRSCARKTYGLTKRLTDKIFNAARKAIRIPWIVLSRGIRTAKRVLNLRRFIPECAKKVSRYMIRPELEALRQANDKLQSELFHTQYRLKNTLHGTQYQSKKSRLKTKTKKRDRIVPGEKRPHLLKITRQEATPAKKGA